MKKRILSLIMAAAMAISVAACANGNTDSSSGGSSASGDKIQLDVVAAQYGSNTQDWWAGFVDDFNKDHADINLNVEVISWNDISTSVSTRIKNDQAPDILNIDVFAAYQADDLLLPAKDYISDETYAKFYESFLAQSDVDGTVWAVPDLASARAMYYNKDILEAAGVAEPPKTWDELKAACEKIKAYDANIYPWGIDMTTDEGQAAFAYYTWNNGADFVDADGNWTLNDPKVVEAVEYEIGLVKDGFTNTDPATETRYDLQDMFGAGKIAMVIAPNSLPQYLADGEYTDINFDFAPIPSNTGENVSAGVMDRFMVFDNDYDEAKLAAITEFFDYFYEDDRYSEWVLMEGFLPATKAGGEAMAAADETQAAWIEIVGSCKFYPVAKEEWDDVKQGVIDVEQQALTGGNIKELLDALQAEIAGE